MSDRIVGSGECSYPAVFNAMNTTSNHATLGSDWFRFARLLDDTGDYSMMDMQYKMGMQTLAQIYEKVLQNWRAKVGDNASLLVLVDILEKNRFKGVADSLRAGFNLSANSAPIGGGDDAFAELDRQKSFINMNLPRLKDYTSVSPSLIADVMAAGIWSHDNSEVLESKLVKSEKLTYFYYEIAKHRGGLRQLQTILVKLNQTGAADVLAKFS